MRLLAVLALFATLWGAPSLAEPAFVGPALGTSQGRPLSSFQTALDANRQLGQGMPQFLIGFADCATLLAIPQGFAPARDHFRQSWVIAQDIRVACWALRHLAPGTELAPFPTGRTLAPQVPRAILDEHLRHADDAEWVKAFMAFQGGEVSCRNALYCTLALADGADPPRQSVSVDLILSYGGFDYVKVSQMVHGRIGLVYGVQLELHDGRPHVVSWSFQP